MTDEQETLASASPEVGSEVAALETATPVEEAPAGEDGAPVAPTE